MRLAIRLLIVLALPGVAFAWLLQAAHSSPPCPHDTLLLLSSPDCATSSGSPLVGIVIAVAGLLALAEFVRVVRSASR